MGGLASGARERRAVVYVRVSTARQAEDGLPIESQVEPLLHRLEAARGLADRARERIYPPAPRSSVR